jgi:site-specific DNA-cytosine methylase
MRRESDEEEWVLYDAYSGLGGFAAGALQAFRERGILNVSVVGIDSDKVPLSLFKQNAAAHAAGVTTICKTIGTDEIDWPDESGNVILHFSPCCQPFSKARAVPAAASALASGLEQMRMILELVLSKQYRRWSIEEVSHAQLTALVKEYATRFPAAIAYDVLDAVSYGCPSERRRLIVSSPAVMKDLKGRTAVEYVSPKQAFEEHEIVPASGFYRNGNVSCVPRPLNRPGFTVTASHPLVFCNADRSLVKCMTPAESAALVGLPKEWKLPEGVGKAQRAVGNVISPLLSRAIVACELDLRSDATPTAADPVTEFVTRDEAADMVSRAVDALRADIVSGACKRKSPDV